MQPHFLNKSFLTFLLLVFLQKSLHIKILFLSIARRVNAMIFLWGMGLNKIYLIKEKQSLKFKWVLLEI